MHTYTHIHTHTHARTHARTHTHSIYRTYKVGQLSKVCNNVPGE